MRKIIVSMFMSMDGVIQGPGGQQEDTTGNFKHSGWITHHWDEMMNDFMSRILSSPYDLLLGRRTYEIFAAHWPYQQDPMAEVFNRVEKFVVANSNPELSWEHSTLIDGDVVSNLQKLKETNGPDLLIYGSSGLVQTLLEHKLIDVLHTWIFPLTLGNGKKLFAGGAQPLEWKLTDSAISTTGVLIATYTPAGEVSTGSVVPDNPSDKELVRRQKMAKGEF